MKTRLSAILAGALILGGTALANANELVTVTGDPAFASPFVMNTGQLDQVVAGDTPLNPGQFGLDRAAYANANGSLGNQTGGVGYYASLRAGDNGSINQDYMLSVSSLPADVTPGQVK